MTMNLADCKSTGNVQAYIIDEILKPLNKDIQKYYKKLAKAKAKADKINPNYWFAPCIENNIGKITDLAVSLDKPAYR
jgi:DNA primase large subunit